MFPFRTAFQFFFLGLGSNGGVTHGDLQMIISWQAKDHPTQACYSILLYSNPLNSARVDQYDFD